MKRFLLPLVLMLSGWTGTVTEVRDGNVVTVLNMETQQPVTVRLWACDAPEIDQPHGQIAQKFLADLVMNHEVAVTEMYRDLQGMLRASLYNGDTFINNEMVAHGLAWFDQRLTPSDILLASYETACVKGLGLWSNKHSIHPKMWRKLYHHANLTLDPVSVAKNLAHLSQLDPEQLPMPQSNRSN